MTENNRFNTKKLFENKKIVLLFSFIAAFIFWMVITITASTDSKNAISGVSISIPTENTVVSNLGLDVISNLEDIKATVNVSGPAYVISGLTVDDFLVTASLSNVTNAGTYELKLNVAKRTTATSNEYEISSVSPSSISVTFDYIDTKLFTVLPKANGASAVEGLTAEDPVVANANHSVLSIKGPRSEIEKIASVTATAQVDAVLSETKSFASVVSLLDKDGKALKAENYTIMGSDGQPVNEIQLTVPIFKRKLVEVKAQFKNAPAKYVNSPIPHTLSEKTILVSGPPETINSITSVPLSEIDFDNLSPENYTFDAALILPEGVKCADNIDTVKVTINNIKDYKTKSFTVTVVSPTKTESSSSVTLSRSIRNVKLMGPAYVINKLSDSDLYAEIDIAGKQAGQHTVTARIRSRSSNEVWQVGSYTASVDIS